MDKGNLIKVVPETKANLEDTSKDTASNSKTELKADLKNNAVEATDKSKMESNTESKISIEDNGKTTPEIAITADNSNEHSKIVEDNTSTPPQNTKKSVNDDPYTCLFLIVSWFLIILTLPFSIFSCFKMVQVKILPFKVTNRNIW